MFATLLNETENGYVVLNPIQVRMVPVFQNGEYNEQTLSNRFCQYSDENQYTFDQKNVVYCKPLHSNMIDHYVKLVLAFGKERNYPEDSKQEEPNMKLDQLEPIEGGYKFH